MKYLTPKQFLAKIRNLDSKFDAELFRAKQEIGFYTLKYFQSSFDRGGFKSGQKTFQTWEDRDYSYPWPILNKGGAGGTPAMRNSFRTSIIGDRIIIENTSTHSQYHNDPTGSWQRNQYTSRSTTQRQFMGNSSTLELWIKRKLQLTLENIFR